MSKTPEQMMDRLARLSRDPRLSQQKRRDLARERDRMLRAAKVGDFALLDAAGRAVDVALIVGVRL